MERAEGRDMARKVAEVIGVFEGGFNQQHYANECGSPSCIAGFTAWLAAGMPRGEGLKDRCGIEVAKGGKKGTKRIVNNTLVYILAKEALELDDTEATYMFDDMPYGEGLDVQPEHAIGLLAHYAATNCVEWPSRATA